MVVAEGARYGRHRMGPLEAAGFELVEGYELNAISDAVEFGRAVGKAWAVLAGGERYSDEVFAQTRDLRVIMRCGAGYDGIDVAAATRRGIAVLTTPQANAKAVADFALALILASLRRLLVLDRSVRLGAGGASGLSHDLTGATVGLVGLGAIGRSVVQRLAGFDCRMLAVEPRPDREFCARWGVELMPLGELLPQVDVLTLHAPLTAETRHLIGERELAQMQPTAILVNTARGGLVDEAALVAALKEGRLAAAALDVFEVEPLPADHPLLSLPNVILSPHKAGWTPLGINATLDAAVTCLLELASGKVPAGCVNPEVGELFAHVG